MELLTRHMEHWPHNNSTKTHQFSIDINRAHQALGVGCLSYLRALDCGSLCIMPMHSQSSPDGTNSSIMYRGIYWTIFVSQISRNLSPI
jgi:hypothetical protein